MSMPGLMKPSAAAPLQRVGIAGERHESSPPIDAGRPSGQAVDRAVVEHPQPAVGGDPEVARVRVGVEQPRPVRRGEQEPQVEVAACVALLRRSRR